MDDATLDSLITSGLNALASSPGGQMTLAAFVTHLETRLGPTDAEAQDARSLESLAFMDTVKGLVTAGGAGSLIDSGFVTLDDTGGLIDITQSGRDFIGR